MDSTSTTNPTGNLFLKDKGEGRGAALLTPGGTPEPHTYRSSVLDAFVDNNTSDTPADTSIIPADTSATPADTSTTPADTTVIPADTSVTPADTSATPTDTTVIPANTSATPADTSSTPADSKDRSKQLVSEEQRKKQQDLIERIKKSKRTDNDKQEDILARVLGYPDSDNVDVTNSVDNFLKDGMLLHSAVCKDEGAQDAFKSKTSRYLESYMSADNL